MLGQADGDGRFSAKLAGPQRPKEGDFVRLRARFDDGSTSDWVTVQAEGRDARPAGLMVNRLELSTSSSGKVSVTSRDDERLINATWGLGAPVVDGAKTPKPMPNMRLMRYVPSSSGANRRAKPARAPCSSQPLASVKAAMSAEQSGK